MLSFLIKISYPAPFWNDWEFLSHCDLTRGLLLSLLKCRRAGALRIHIQVPFSAFIPAPCPTHTFTAASRWPEEAVPLSSPLSPHRFKDAATLQSCPPLTATPQSSHPGHACSWSCTPSGDTALSQLVNIWYRLTWFSLHKENDLVQRKPFERELVSTWIFLLFYCSALIVV